MNIGPIQLATPFVQAGLAGYSDRAMRLVARRRGCPYAVTEALLDVILVNGGEGLRKSIDVNDEDHPVAGQVIGSEPATLAKAAAILAGRGYDVIDLNFACPVKKIKNKARGGHMLRDVPRARDVLRAARDAVPAGVPTTVSLRRAFDDSPESRDAFFAVADAAWDAGYSAVRVHGRTVEQKYLGRADWPFLREVKDRYPNRTILGSGDVFTAEDAVRMFRETGVDLVWVARGAIGNPWIFRHATELLRRAAAPAAAAAAAEGSTIQEQDELANAGQRPAGAIHAGDARARSAGNGITPVATPRDPRPAAPAIFEPESASSRGQNRSAGGLSPPGIAEQRETLAEHFREAMRVHGEQLAGRRMRKMGIKYSRFHPDHAVVKTAFIDVVSLRDWEAVLDRHYTADGPGAWPAAAAADEVNDPAAEPLTCEA